jgi:hypothetical protein
MNDLIAKLYPQQCFADVCRVFGGELFFLVAFWKLDMDGSDCFEDHAALFAIMAAA